MFDRTDLTPRERLLAAFDIPASTPPTRWTSLPDFRVHLAEIERVDDVIMSRSRFVATHGGVIFGLSPTGGRLDMPSLDIFFFRDGN